MSYVDRCEVCDGEPMWNITRRGDVVTSWACGPHLSGVCDAMQRDFEVTELVVVHFAKRHEIAALRRILDEQP